MAAVLGDIDRSSTSRCEVNTSFPENGIHLWLGWYILKFFYPLSKYYFFSRNKFLPKIPSLKWNQVFWVQHFCFRYAVLEEDISKIKKGLTASRVLYLFLSTNTWFIPYSNLSGQIITKNIFWIIVNDLSDIEASLLDLFYLYFSAVKVRSSVYHKNGFINSAVPNSYQGDFQVRIPTIRLLE